MDGWIDPQLHVAKGGGREREGDLLEVAQGGRLYWLQFHMPVETSLARCTHMQEILQ